MNGSSSDSPQERPGSAQERPGGRAGSERPRRERRTTVTEDALAFAEKVEDAGHTAADAVREQAQIVREQAEETADAGKEAGARHLDVVARALGRAADELATAMPEIAGYVRQAATQVDDVSGKLRGGRIEDLAGSVGDFARRQPVMLLGASALAGFALTRLLGASTRPADRDEQPTRSTG